MKRVSCVVLAIAVVAVVAVVLMRPRGAKVSEGTAVVAQAVAETAGSKGVARQVRDSAAVPAARSVSGDSSVSSFPASTTYDPSFPKSRQVLLANRRIVLEDGRAFPKRFAAAQSSTARGTAPYVVIGEAPVSREMRVRVSENGARVIGFLPDNAMLVEADEPSLRRLEEDGLFAAAVEYEPTDKIQRRVFESAGETVEVTVVMMNVADNASVRSFVTANGGKLISDTTNGGETLYVEMPTAMVGRLAAMAEVKWIENYGHLKLCNDQAVLPQVMNVTPVWSSCGLTGEGQVIATLDSGIDTGNLDTLNADFGGQVVEIAQFSSGDKADYTGHGTHTAGSIAGTGANSDGKFKGVAHGAKLLIQSGSSEQQTFHPYHEKGVREWFTYKRKEVGYGVRSDSWGNANHGVYNDRCRLCDDCIWNDPELLEVVAVGNEGGSFSPDSSVNDPASSKNVLAVGATGNRRFYAKDEPNDNNINDISTYSSLGPTADGRIKPDVCAPGEFVVSVASSKAIYGAYFDTSQKYAYNSGSSMATPLTAGCAALVREWLMKYRGYGETKPTAALMKAVLMGGATNISENSWMGWLYGAPPSNFQGWGRVNLGESIFPTGGLGVYLKDRLPFKTGTNFVFTVATTNAASLRAQLVWIDYPAQEEAAVAIVNDLDLTVENAAKTKWFGNGGSAADDRNTVESVRIEEAAAGTYKVTVSCSKIVYDHTKGGAAAIYIRGAFDPATVTMNGEPGGDVPIPPVIERHMPYRLSFNGVNGTGCAMVNDSDDVAKGSVSVAQIISGYRNYSTDAKDGYSHQVNSGTMGIVANEAGGKMLARGLDGYVVAFWMKDYGEKAWKDVLGLRIGKVRNFGLEKCNSTSYSLYDGSGEPVIYGSGQPRGDYVLPIKQGEWDHVAIRVPPKTGAPVVYVNGKRICEFYTTTSSPYQFDIGDRNLYQVLFGVARTGTAANGGERNMGNGNVRFDEFAIYTGDFTEDEMAWFATQSIAKLPPTEVPDPSLFYIALGRYLPLETPFQRP